MTFQEPFSENSALRFSELREQLDHLFTPARLAAYIPQPASETERAGLEWVLQDGKRWRPLLTVACYLSLAHHPAPEYANHAALAVEFLHKASLVHDDIQDSDLRRYGRPTLHARYGIPMAINIGDFLIGEGYRLLAVDRDTPGETRARLVAIAANGQRKLTIGQGGELEINAGLKPLPSLEEYLRLARYKTGSAFEVALLLGAVLARAEDKTIDPLVQYSNSLGVAYQIEDDLSELEAPGSIPVEHRPTVLLALAAESSSAAMRQACQDFWVSSPAKRHAAAVRLRDSLLDDGVAERARAIARSHFDKAQHAIESLPQLDFSFFSNMFYKP